MTLVLAVAAGLTLALALSGPLTVQERRTPTIGPADHVVAPAAQTVVSPRSDVDAVTLGRLRDSKGEPVEAIPPSGPTRAGTNVTNGVTDPVCPNHEPCG
jgi:hypothetical protein